MHTPPDYLAQNRQLWNAKTDYHVASQFYDMASFRAGQSSLREVELGLLGDVAGSRFYTCNAILGRIRCR